MHQRLIKYLEGTCTEQELAQVLAYLTTEEGQQHLASLMDEDIQKISQQHNVKDDTDYDRIFGNINRTIQNQRASPRARVASSRIRFLAAATVAGLIIAAAAVWFSLLSSGPATYRTAYGETSSINLPDGTTVTLNAHSTLTVAENFREQRVVWLEGEAFFEVEKSFDPSQQNYSSFVVHTDRLQVEVLGTTFNVQNRKDKTQVVLTSGKVHLTSAANQPVALEPGELAEVTPEHPAIRKEVVNPGIYSAWIENKLLCDETPLSEVALTIEHRYGKKVIFENPALRDRLVTGTIPLDDLSILIEVLQESLTITFRAHENSLVIRQ